MPSIKSRRFTVISDSGDLRVILILPKAFCFVSIGLT
jgi:hypothetical protein